MLVLVVPVLAVPGTYFHEREHCQHRTHGHSPQKSSLLPNVIGVETKEKEKDKKSI